MRRSRMLPALLALVAVGLLVHVAAGTEIEIEKRAMTYGQASRGDGAQLYAEACAACHGPAGRGDGPAAPALAAPVPDLTRLALQYEGAFPADEVRRAIRGEATIVAHGDLDMPVWGKVFLDVRPDWKLARRAAFAEQRIDALTEYLRTIQTVR